MKYVFMSLLLLVGLVEFIPRALVMLVLVLPPGFIILLLCLDDGLFEVQDIFRPYCWSLMRDMTNAK